MQFSAAICLTHYVRWVCSVMLRFIAAATAVLQLATARERERSVRSFLTVIRRGLTAQHQPVVLGGGRTGDGGQPAPHTADAVEQQQQQQQGEEEQAQEGAGGVTLHRQVGRGGRINTFRARREVGAEEQQGP